MAVSGKMMMYVNINSRGDVLHDIVRFRPNDIASMLPDKVHSCVLLDGQWERLDPSFAGTLHMEIEEVNEANHKIVFKVLEARPVDKIYKSFKIIFHVEQEGDGKLAAVTFEFEKANSKIPYPTAFMDYLCDVFSGVDEYNSDK